MPPDHKTYFRFSLLCPWKVILHFLIWCGRLESGRMGWFLTGSITFHRHFKENAKHCYKLKPKSYHKVWGKKKCTRVCVYYKNYARFRQKSIKSAKSTHPENSKLVRQVHVVQKVPPGSMIEQKNGFCENTIFVKNYLQKKVHLHLWFSCKIC